MIDVKEILDKYIHYTDDNKWIEGKSEKLNIAIKTICEEVLKEAAENAEIETYYPNPYTNENYERVNQNSITSVINKVKF